MGIFFSRAKKEVPVPPELCDDIIREILSRLPKETLLKFLNVSKSWRYLISEIVNLSVNGVIVQSKTTSYDGSGSVTRKYFGLPGDGDDSGSSIHSKIAASSFWFSNKDYRILDICNGLLLYRDLTRNICGVHYPANRMWRRLPPTFSCLGHAGLVFDPQLSPYFSVVRFLDPTIFGIMAVEIYDSEGSHLSRIIVSDQRSGGEIECRYIYMNDIMFIFFKCERQLEPSYTLIGLNVRQKTSRTISLPPADHIVTVGKCREHLHCASSLGNRLRIWSLEIDGEQEFRWNLVHTCSYNRFKRPWGPYVQMFNFSVVLCFHTNSDAIFIRDRWRIFCYYWNSGEFIKVCNADCLEIFPVSFQPFSTWAKPYWL